MNELLMLAAQVREHYIKALLASFVEFKAAYSPSSLEVMFELQRQESLPYRLYRADMAANVSGEAKLQEVNASTHLSFKPFKLDTGGSLVATLHPVVWNDVGIKTNVRLPDALIEDWAMQWLDMDDHHAQDENGLQGVIHSISRDDTGDEGTELTVDFGSAPVGALNDLIEILRTCGVLYITIHSGSLQ
jgi:hypothetical protein